MIIKKIVFLSLLFIAANFYCQDSIKKKAHNFIIEAGISENVPFKTNYNETKGNRTSFYSSYQYYNYITLGFYSTIGYQIKLNNNLFITPNLSYYFIHEKQAQVGESSCPACDIYIYISDFKGTITNDKKSHLLAFSTSLSYQLKKLRFEIGIGVTDYIIYKNKTNYYTYNNTSETSSTFVNNHSPINIKFYSQHKLGYELLKNRLDVFLGSYIFFNRAKTFTPAINPTLSFRFKL